MTPARWNEVREVLGQLLDLSRGERAGPLAALDPEMRREVEVLLACEQDATAFLSPEALEPILRAPATGAPARVGPYQVIREIGRGGMGVVYLAQRDDGQFEKQVAIKLLPALFRSAEMERWFKRERAILARLEHPGVVRLLDGGVTEDGQPFLIMEYVEEGVPLTAWALKSRLNLTEKLRLYLEVCAAVSYAHGKLIVHRDLKPSNVLVDAAGHAKLLDFGLARMIGLAEGEDTGAQSQRLIMTPAYASPEQIRGEPLAVTTDIFSLGVMLYELSSGHRPFESESKSMPQVLLAVCEEDPPPPSRMGGGTPELDFIVLKALEKDPARRYASVDALSSDVLACLEHRPIAARPAGPLYRLGKFVRRHRVGSALGTAALIAIAVATSLAIRGTIRAQRQFDQTRKLANSVLFELHDAISPLPGSTKARDLIVRRGMEYLDALSREPGVDASLRWELADGYLRLGDVTGQSGSSNLGNVSGALESYKKGVTLLEGVVREIPKNRDLARDLGKAYRLLGYALIDNGNLAEGRGAFEQALRLSATIDSGDRRDRRTRAVNHFALGFALTNENQFKGALEEYGMALRIFEEILSGDGGKISLRDVALCHKRIGAIYGRLGDYAQAVASFELAANIDQRVVAADPTSYQARMDLSYSYSDLGLNLQSLNRLPDALAANEKALSIRLDRTKEDPSDARAANGVAVSYRRRAEILLAQNNPRKAVLDFEESARRFQELAHGSGVNASREEDQGLVEYRWAQALAGLGRQAEAVPHWRNARDLWTPLAKSGLLPATYVPLFEKLQKLDP